MFAKCFLSAAHSIEEHVDDLDARYTVIKLLVLLHNNWRNFLDSVNKTVQNWKWELDRTGEEMKALRTQQEAELKDLEEKHKKDHAKFEMKPLVQQFNLLKEKHHQMKISMEHERKEMASQISLLTVNNKKLAERIKKVEEDADVILNAAKIQKLSTDLHQAQEMLKKEKEEKSKMGFKLHILLEETKNDVKKRDLVIGEKGREYDDLLRIYHKTKAELDDNRALVRENLERMKMSAEDGLQIQLKLARMKTRLNEKNSSIDELTKKVEELEIQLKLQREGLVQKKEISMEGTLFYFVQDNPLAKLNNQNKTNARKDRLEAPPGEQPDEKAGEHVADKVVDTGEIRLDTINTGKYNYLRPTYKALIEDLLPTEDHEKVSYVPPFPVWLHVVIRAIFDSKQNEILLSYNKGKRISRFPEYVYAWLGTFGVDKETRNIKLLEYTEKEAVARENRRNLLLGLEAASAGKLWEISIFKEFLEEDLAVDELAYFLHTRFILFRGPQLAVPTAGFCVTHFVTKEKVFDTIDKIMYGYTADERKELKRKLVEFSKQTYKDANAFDYAMVLRILLEFYRREKKENFARLEELYSGAKKVSRGGRTILPFDSFYRIMAGDYDKNIGDQEVASLYRESFVAGGCCVSLDSILLTLSDTYLPCNKRDRPFWVRYLRLRGQSSEPHYDARGDIDQTDDKGKECALVYSY